MATSTNQFANTVLSLADFDSSETPTEIPPNSLPNSNSPISDLFLSQRKIISKLEASTTALDSFNTFSQTRYSENLANMQRYTKTIVTLRDDLDLVFKRIRTLKETLRKKHPKEFNMACDEIGCVDVEDDD
ncbi:hypothetical protein HK096_001226 [Nowakowskiella sp. JEL0078]|nr:hypothetical protein HK096_001226 [Nowakowskiella sp. JEL0078]